MGTLLDALSQENLDNQREVVKNEKRWSYDNRPYGSWNEKILGPPVPRGAPVPPPDDRLDGGPRRGLGRRRQGVLPRRTTRPTTRSCRVVGDCDRATGARAGRDRYFGPIPANPSIPPLPDLSLPPLIGTELREVVEDRVPLPRVYIGFRAPAFGDRRLDALDLATQLLAGGKGSRLHRRLVRDERLAQDVAVFTLPFIGGASICVGWATVRPGVDIATVEAAYLEELERLAARGCRATTSSTARRR